MHITEFLKTNSHIKVEIAKEGDAIKVSTESNGHVEYDYVSTNNLKPGDVESAWFKLIDKIVAKQNEVAATGNS